VSLSEAVGGADHTRPAEISADVSITGSCSSVASVSALTDPSSVITQLHSGFVQPLAGGANSCADVTRGGDFDFRLAPIGNHDPELIPSQKVPAAKPFTLAGSRDRALDCRLVPGLAMPAPIPARQIAAALAGRRGLDAVHVVARGAPGRVSDTGQTERAELLFIHPSIADIPAALPHRLRAAAAIGGASPSARHFVQQTANSYH